MVLGLHIADFTWTGGARALGPALARHVREAEAAGIRRISVMDHFWQIRGVGPAEHEMLEAYSALGFIVAHTERALLHTLVTGVIYREPGLLAKAVTTLDVLSGGRVGLGIGAAWNEDESRGLGFDFPPVGERFSKLEEAIRICLQMWSDSEEPFHGEYYQLTRTLNSPQSLARPHPYLMIGGSGEKKTLRLVAQYADACNIFAGPDAARKLDVLRAHCDASAATTTKSRRRRCSPSTRPAPSMTSRYRRRPDRVPAATARPRLTEPDRIIALFADATARLN